jgi:hypothetical protein
MPLTITVDVTCDGCGATIMQPREVKQAEIDGIRWDHKRRGVAVERTRRLTKFYCAECADKPQK